MGKIDSIVKNGLCSSCGVCVANCPVECIEMVRSGYEYHPSIDTNKCIDCGICGQICSKSQAPEYKASEDIEEYLLGEYKDIFAAQIKDENILENATSGGVVTGIIKRLLDDGIYDTAFLLDGYNYDGFLRTKKFTVNDDFYNTAKSRYLTVSHEETVKYMRAHVREKIIIVATGCAVQSILNSIQKWKLQRGNYLIVGLFCDKTMHYGVYEYFKEHPLGEGKSVEQLYFRTKQAGGWPGNVRIVYSDGSCLDRPKTDRMKVKDYFLPESCLYCLDKLNRYADISVGDNYVKDNADKNGISSVIIRSELGKEAWLHCLDNFNVKEENDEAIKVSQKLKEKRINYKYAILKGLYEDNEKVSWLEKWEYRIALEKIGIGKSTNIYSEINKDIQKRKNQRYIRKIINGIRKRLG